MTRKDADVEYTPRLYDLETEDMLGVDLHQYYTKYDENFSHLTFLEEQPCADVTNVNCRKTFFTIFPENPLIRPFCFAALAENGEKGVLDGAEANDNCIVLFPDDPTRVEQTMTPELTDPAYLNRCAADGTWRCQDDKRKCEAGLDEG